MRILLLTILLSGCTLSDSTLRGVDKFQRIRNDIDLIETRDPSLLCQNQSKRGCLITMGKLNIIVVKKGDYYALVEEIEHLIYGSKHNGE